MIWIRPHSTQNLHVRIVACFKNERFTLVPPLNEHTIFWWVLFTRLLCFLSDHLPRSLADFLSSFLGCWKDPSTGCILVLFWAAWCNIFWWRPCPLWRKEGLGLHAIRIAHYWHFGGFPRYSTHFHFSQCWTCNAPQARFRLHQPSHPGIFIRHSLYKVLGFTYDWWCDPWIRMNNTAVRYVKLVLKVCIVVKKFSIEKVRQHLYCWTFRRFYLKEVFCSTKKDRCKLIVYDTGIRAYVVTCSYKLSKDCSKIK